MATQHHLPTPVQRKGGGGARDLLGFLAFSHGWTWLFWMTAGLVGESIWAFPGVLFFYLGGAGVFLGGIVMSRVTYGPRGLRELGRRIADPRLVAGRWWAVIVLFFPVLALSAATLAVLSGLTGAPFDLAGARQQLADPGQLLVMAAFILIIGPLPEEIGWRGYLLDRLQLRSSALVASLLLAVIWWTWHLPLFALPGYYAAFGHTPPSPLGFLYGLIPAAVLYTWVYNNTSRSVLAVIVFHFMQNFTGEFLGLSPEVRSVQLVLSVVAALIVTLGWGPLTLRRNDPAPGRAPEHEGTGGAL